MGVDCELGTAPLPVTHPLVVETGPATAFSRIGADEGLQINDITSNSIGLSISPT